MKIGDFRLGNSHKFDIKKVVVYKDEDISKLNKIELRYNTRKHLPSYPAMKSLYSWRSVFGYHLGGLLRQAAAKIANVPRPFINAFNLLSTIKHTSILDYDKLHTSRDIMIALRKSNQDSHSVKMLKYMSFNQIPEKYHQMADDSDRSLKTVFVRQMKAYSQNKNLKQFFVDQNKFAKEYNEKIDQKYPPNSPEAPKKLEIIDVDAKMKEIGNYKSDRQTEWQDRKERIAFKATAQKERLVNFFRSIPTMGVKFAYERLVDRSKRDEESYQSQFNRVSDTPKPTETRGLLGEIIRDRPVAPKDIRTEFSGTDIHGNPVDFDKDPTDII